MKTIFSALIIILLHTILNGACPRMKKKMYYVNSIEFTSQYDARKYIAKLKTKERKG